MINGTIISKERVEQMDELIKYIEDAQIKLKEVKYRGTYPTLYDFLNWSLKNSENLLKDIKNVISVDNRIILSRKLFEIYISIKVTKENVKLGEDKEKLIPKFMRSEGKKLEIRRLCDKFGINKDFYSFYSTFAHPYTYSKLGRRNDFLNIETSHMLYNINDYEYQINSLNQMLLLYIANDMIDDINYIIRHTLCSSKEQLIENFELNKEFVYKDATEHLIKINKRLDKRK